MPDAVSTFVSLASGGGCLAVSPYLARLTMTVPDRNTSRWWRGGTAGSARLAGTAATAAVLGLLSGAAATNVTSGLWLLPAYLLLAVLGTPLLVIDVAHHRLPDRLVLPLAVGEIALLGLAAAGEIDLADWLRALEAGAAVFAAFFAVAFASPDSFGFGDVKLGGVLGAALGVAGWSTVLGGVVVGFVLGALVGLATLVGGRRTLKTPIPFGPMLILGALLVLALSSVEV